MPPVPEFLRRGPFRTLPDRDVLVSLAFAALTGIATLGLAVLAALAWTFCVALAAPLAATQAGSVLLFGKRLVEGVPDADFLARIARAHALVSEGVARRLVVLGGATARGASEASVARAALQRLGLPAHVVLLVDERSQDTLENLQQARRLLGDAATQPVALVSSRYHLPRCLFLARALGFDATVCASEARFTLDARHLRRLLLEGLFIYWIAATLALARLVRWQRWLHALRGDA